MDGPTRKEPSLDRAKEESENEAWLSSPVHPATRGLAAPRLSRLPRLRLCTLAAAAAVALLFLRRRLCLVECAERERSLP